MTPSEKLTFFRRFTYSFLYPAILGSMVYDAILTTHWRAYLSEDFAPHLCQLLVVVLFVLDWLFVFHPKSKLRKGKLSAQQKLAAAQADLSSVFLYLAAFAFADRTAADGWLVGYVTNFTMFLLGGAYFIVLDELSITKVSAVALLTGLLSLAALILSTTFPIENIRLATLTGIGIAYLIAIGLLEQMQ